MASVFAATTEGEEAIVGTTTETLLQLRGSTVVKTKVIAWGVSFDSATAADAPVVVRLLFQTTDGTASAATEVPLDPDNPTANTTAFHTFTAEPTAGGVVESHEVFAQGGNLIREYPPGREPTLDNATTSRIGIDVTAPTGCNALAWIHFEE